MFQPPAAQIARQAAGALAALFMAATMAGAQAPAPPPAVQPAGIVRTEIPAPPAGENHGAAIAQLRSGALLACWYSGDHEEDRSVRILCSRSNSDGVSWSSPWTAVSPGDRAVGAAAPDKSLGNVTLTVTSGGRVWMIHGVIQSRIFPVVGETCRNWSCGRIDARVSGDEGRTWSRASRLVDSVGALPRAEPKPSGGAYLVPFYEETEQRSAIAIVSLADGVAKVSAIWPFDGPQADSAGAGRTERRPLPRLLPRPAAARASTPRCSTRAPAPGAILGSPACPIPAQRWTLSPTARAASW